ncbi:MFS transporter [Actinopolyspora erythraea]|uniref:MFS transporter n=1 Tax=Actinopolyspora erythraea TaxID=414996 RepID=A0A223RRP8_9ACTN|nr:MFS transporter [Actinopolyspora erythraea]
MLNETTGIAGSGSGVPKRNKSNAFSFLLSAAGILIVAINLRPAIASVAPVVGQIQSETGLSNTATGLLTTVPLLCFVLLSTTAPRLGRSYGEERTIALALLLLLAGILLRVVPAAVALFGGTVLVGVAITGGNVLLPTVIKKRFGAQSGVMTGLYTMGISIGTAAAAGLTIPWQQLTGVDWRTALAVWAIPAVLAVLLWIPQHRERRPPSGGTTGSVRGRQAWRSALGWGVTGFFALLSLTFYTVIAWLPKILTESGMDPATGGQMLSLANLVGIPFSLTAPILAARSGRQVWITTSFPGLLLLGLLGLTLSPGEGTVFWVLILGVGLGGTIGIGFMLVVLRAADSQGAAALAAMSQTAGYSVAATGPILTGALRDLTGSWTLPLLSLCLLVAIQIPIGMFVGQNRQFGATGGTGRVVLRSRVTHSRSSDRRWTSVTARQTEVPEEPFVPDDERFPTEGSSATRDT